jgi:hypothetical protein
MTEVRAVEDGTVRDDPPSPSDFGLVTRPIGAGPGGATVEIPVPTTGGVTTVAASLASIVILAANANRAGFSIRNTSATATLYILQNTLGGAASATNHTVALVPGAYYEDPYRYVDDVIGVWVGVLDPTDAAMVTEYIP